jgi:CubicO group peptidase (beta-lactamase class C family)
MKQKSNRSATANFQIIMLGLALSLSFADTSYSQEQTSILELRLADTEPADGLVEVTDKKGNPFYLHPNAVVREDDVTSVKESAGNGSSKLVSVRLTRAAGKKMSEATESHLRKPMAILFKGKLVSAPIIQTKISRDFVISGDFTSEQIQEMIVALSPQPRASQLHPDDLTDFSERLDRAHQRKKFSGTVLIAVDGKIVLEKSVGYANIKSKSPLQDNSSFRLASVSKQFTAMGIMILKDDGKLDFDDEITKHLPELPYTGVTIRHLIHHTGGLPSYIGLMERHWDKGSKGSDKKTAFNQDVVDMLAKRKPQPDFSPGDQYEYSNTGYVLLGSIIEKASGMAIHEFFKKRIFEPLEMNDSHVFRPTDDFKPASRVFGFAYGGPGEFEENDHNFLNGMVGDGGIYASARDLLKWDQGLGSGKLVKAATLKEAYTSGKTNDGSKTGYGFGVLIDHSKNHGMTISHDGAWVGFRTSITRQPDRKLTVIILSNNTTTQLDQIQAAIREL